MAEKDDRFDGPVEELKDYRVEKDPDLPGRVQRSINRNVLAGDSLELVFTGLTRTAWNYLQLVVDFLDGSTSRKGDDAPLTRDDRPPTDEEPGS